MPIRRRGGAGGGAGGGGIAFNTPRDIFNGATRAAAEALRDSTITDTAPWDDDPILGIILTWPVVVTDTIYQVRRSGQWVDVGVLVEGEDGGTGPRGPQSRIVLYAYINTAVAPTVPPTGGDFIQSSGVKTVPAGYTAAAVTPPAGQKTYRPEAIVNPAVDADTVNLVWSIPAELPAYAAATLAEEAADEAEVSATAAAASAALVGSYSGPVAILDAVAFESNNIDLTVGGWRDYDFLQFVPRDGDAGTQFSRPAPSIPTADLDTVGESRVPINNNDELRVERTAASDVLSINITGWTGHPATGDVITVYGIRSGVEAGGGGGGGGGLTSAQVQALINATELSALQGAVVDTQIPAAITRDTELAAAALGWQDEGMDLAAVTSINLVGAGVAGAVANGVLTIAIAGGGVPPTHTSQYLALKSTDNPLAADFEGANGVAFTGASHTATAPATPAGNVYLLLWRISTDPEPTFLDVDDTGLNAFGTLMKQAATIDLTNGDTGEVWVSENALPYQGSLIEFR